MNVVSFAIETQTLDCVYLLYPWENSNKVWIIKIWQQLKVLAWFDIIQNLYNLHVISVSTCRICRYLSMVAISYSLLLTENNDDLKTDESLYLVIVSLPRLWDIYFNAQNQALV